MTDDRDDTGVAVGRGAALALAVALLVVLGMLLAPAVAWVGPTGAIGLTVLLFGAVLALPAARFRRWPAQDRTAAVAAVVPALGRATVLTLGLVLLAGLGTASVTPGASPLLPHLWRLVLPDGGILLALPVMIGALTVAMRRVTPRGWAVWSRRRDLAVPLDAESAGTLRRIRTWRTVPAVAGAAIGVMPQALMNLAYVLDVPGTALRDRLQAQATTWPTDPLTLALLGTLVGAVLVEVDRARRYRSVGAATEARLEVRTPAVYLTPVARWLPPGLASLVAVLTAAAQLRGSTEPWWPAAVGAALAVAVVAVQRWIVRRPQRQADARTTALDDAARSSAAHAVAGTSSAVLLVMAVGALDPLVGSSVTGGAAGGVLGLALVAAIVWLWFGYGSGHRGRTPARSVDGRADGRADGGVAAGEGVAPSPNADAS